MDLIRTPLEELDTDRLFALVIDTISMHEFRDLQRVTANIRASLDPGGSSSSSLCYRRS